jgi:hypothetical protein
MVEWSITGKDKFVVKYMQKVSGILTVIQTRRINPTRVSIAYKDRSFPFYANIPSYRSKNTFVYLIDVFEGQLKLKDADATPNPEVMHKVLKKNVIQQLVSGLESTPFSQLLIYILLSVGLGISLGYIFGNFIPIG